MLVYKRLDTENGVCDKTCVASEKCAYFQDAAHCFIILPDYFSKPPHNKVTAGLPEKRKQK